MMKMMLSEGHGEGGIFENVLKGDNLVGGDEGDDVKASVAVERKKTRLSGHG
jgi:hypothetical protein